MVVKCEECKKEFVARVRFCSARCKLAFHRHGANQEPLQNDTVTKAEPRVFKIGCPAHGKKNCIICTQKK